MFWFVHAGQLFPDLVITLRALNNHVYR